MATSYLTKQVVGGTATSVYSTLYNTAGAATAVVSSIIVCNEAGSAVTVRVGLATTAGTPVTGSWLMYDCVVNANDSLVFNGPVTLGTATYIRTSSSAATVSFTAGVAEIS